MNLILYMNTLIIKLIQIIHIIFILFVIGVPFINSKYLLMLHSIFIPFLILHWLTNNNTCCLTMTEKYLRGIKNKKDEDECFTCRLINPIFNFKLKDKDINKYLYMLVISLWIISIFKLSYKVNSGEIKTWRDLFII